jgi:hypothetical protein
MSNYIFTDKFSAGTGNQLFVYFYGMMYSEKFKIPYYHPGIKTMNIPPNPIKNKNSLPIKKIFNFIEQLDNYSAKFNYNIEYSFEPTIENYHIFKQYVNQLKNILPIKYKTYNKDDLVYHFRAGDYFFDNNHYLLNGDKLEKVINNIKYKKLYGVTNLRKFSAWNMDEYIAYRKEYLSKGEHCEPYKESQCVQPPKFQEVLDHINGVINVLNKFNCEWISDSVYEDFNSIRSFNKIIINVSTLSWWAAVLSDANEVYAPKDWKWKKRTNKNLPYIGLQGWNTVEL